MMEDRENKLCDRICRLSQDIEDEKDAYKEWEKRSLRKVLLIDLRQIMKDADFKQWVREKILLQT
jgi:hypothetical protein